MVSEFHAEVLCTLWPEVTQASKGVKSTHLAAEPASQGLRSITHTLGRRMPHGTIVRFTSIGDPYTEPPKKGPE